MVYKRSTMYMIFVVLSLFLAANAEFYPERICKQREKISMNANWKFATTFTGNPSDKVYNDDSWAKVNIPHSASYDEPVPMSEKGGFIGDCWYRKTFTFPQVSHSDKIYLEFEGAMQTAEVWLNGIKVGVHDNSGYTGFYFDVTDNIDKTGANVLAVKLNNQYSEKIPPGLRGIAGAADTYPDYYMYSGLYRDVWLVCTDNVYIPLYGQKIETKDVSTTSAKIRIKTNVCNASADSKNCSMQYIVCDATQKEVLRAEQSADIAAGAQYPFDKTCDSIVNPNLWSPETPNLYYVYTIIRVDGKIVDDNVERIGIRWYNFADNDGFYLNGSKYKIKGACLHQSFAWVENALPNTRFFKEVELIKDMGANLIRCSHFPRDPSFYNACDELGMLVMVEVPSWGAKTDSYVDEFWTRLGNCMKEMIDVGYNHPSIITWGIFNEPKNEFLTQLKVINDIAHGADSTRVTSISSNQPENNHNTIPDVVGLNYNLTTTKNKKTINTEYHEGWVDWCFRGDKNEATYADTRWKKWTAINNSSTLAGGCMWSFNDYWSPFMDHPMGVIDHYRIPKQVFYKFRKEWTGKEMDLPVTGITPVKVELVADLTKLISDSTDIAKIEASIRDNTGKCVSTAVDVTFEVSGPVDVFGPKTLKTIVGKIAMIVKSTNTAGPITIKATSGSLEPATIELTSAPADTSTLFFPVGIHNPWATSDGMMFRAPAISMSRGTIRLHCVSVKAVALTEISLLNIQGKKLTVPVTESGATVSLDIKNIGAGVYILRINNNGNLYSRKKILTQ